MRVGIVVLVCLGLLAVRPRATAAQPPSPPAVAAPPATTAAPPGQPLEEPPEDMYPPPAPADQTAMAVRSTLSLVLMLLVAAFLFRRYSGGSSMADGGWSTYYLFWLVVPLVLAIVTAHPAVLVIAVVGFLARRWLPDPIQWLRHARRTEALESQVRLNPTNSVARRELAMIWIDKRKPARALPHLEAARQRDGDDLELRMLEGQAQALAGQHAEAVTTFEAVTAREPKFRYGAAHRARGDSLAALGRWPDAEGAWRDLLRANSSSVEAHVKVAKARSRQGDGPGADAERQAARALYRELPVFQRRQQRWWYVRALVGL